MAKLKITWCVFVVAAFCASAFGQLWPVPDYTRPNAEKPCVSCLYPNKGLPTPGWSDPVQRYVGRFMSSEYVSDWQQPFRTVRADGVKTNPSGTRLYEKFGNAIAVYDAARFLSRLDSHEALVPISQLPASPTAGSRFGDPLETFLQVDRYFYAEDFSSGWICPVQDGQDRLFDWDIDDRGFVYLANSIFGWGVARDNTGAAGILPSWQDTSALTWGPTRVNWVKDGGAYYAFVGRWLIDTTHVYLVPDSGNPVEQTQFPKGIVKLARAGTRTALIDNATNSLNIYDTHTLVSNGSPMASYSATGTGAIFNDVIWDGTRFWASSYSQSYVGSLSSFTPNANGGYTRVDYTLANGQFFQPLNMQYASGYIAMTASDISGATLHLYKIGTGQPVELPIPSINNYFNPPVNYARAPHTQLVSVQPLVAGGSLYLIVSAHGLGDVYQIKADDAVTVTRLQNTVGGVNPSTPARDPGTVFYGDALQFQAAISSGGTGTAVTWDYGDGRTEAGATGSVVTHQYSGLTASQVTAGLTVKATNPATGVVGSTPVTFAPPTVRFGVGGSSPRFLLSLPNASSPAPIVLGDSFFDASDGDATGHITEWRIGDSVNYFSPTSPVSVGPCGTRAMQVIAHYGTLTSSDPGYPVTLPTVNGSNSFGYSVRAFSPAVDGSLDAATGKIKFVSGSRASTQIASYTVSYAWDVIESSGTSVAGTTVTGPGASDPSPMTIDRIPAYLVDPAVFSVSGRRARLTITMDDGGICSGVVANPAPPTGRTTSASALSAPLVPPDAQLGGGCTGNNCQFSITSPTGVMTSDAWTATWSAPGGNPNAGLGTTFTPAFAKAGTYTVSVLVTNKIGLTVTRSTNVTIAQDASACPTMTDSTVFLYSSGTSCSGSTCNVTFGVTFWQYPDSCATHTYQWTFDDNSTASGISVTKALASGTHTATCVVSNPSQSLTLHLTVNVTATSTPPPPPPPPPTQTGCPILSAGSNVFVAYSGPTSGCSSAAVTCNTTEQIQFTVSYWNYNTSCATHSYQWTFDDGTTGTGQTVYKTFATAGTHTASCTVNNGSQSVTVSTTVVVGAGAPPPPASCGTLTSVNTFASYAGPTTGCKSGSNTNCAANEPVAFSISFWTFSPSCTISYAWTFDDGGTASGQNVTHAFTTGGPHTATCTVTYSSQTFPLTLSLNVAGNPATPAPEVTVAVDYLGAGMYKFTPTVKSGTVTKFIWDFGDGSTTTVSDSRSVTNTYTKPGRYTVTLTAQSTGQSAVVTTVVDVSAVSRSRAARH